MMQRRRTRVSFILVAAIVLAVLPVGAAQAYTTWGCRWSSSSISVNINTVSAYSTAYNTAKSTWSNKTDVYIYSSSSSPWNAVSAYYGNTGWDGQDTYTCNLLNRRQYNTTYLNRTTLDSYPAAKKAVVAMHEFGHGIGLGHVSSQWDLMYSCAACAYDNGVRTLSSDDISGANARY